LTSCDDSGGDGGLADGDNGDSGFDSGFDASFDTGFDTGFDAGFLVFGRARRRDDCSAI
jgi:hypothetical protein